jgi:aminopeptidase N
MKNLIAIAATILLVSCQSPEVKESAGPVAAKHMGQDANLTLEEATERANGLGNISYSIALQLEETSPTFAGNTQVEFFLKKAKALFLEFKDGKVESVRVNGNEAKIEYDGFRIYIPQNLMKDGKNSVQVGYTAKYSNNGSGLHKFVDPEDKNVYLHSQFEAYDAHKMFPCFDQPDLKATYKLEVVAPQAWSVISTTKESVTAMTGTQKKWIFEETPQLSTYVFSLHAGPYKVWVSKAGDIPLRLFARKSIAKKVVAEEWFAPTRYAIKFYGEYFDFPYPFHKLDSVIPPEFNAGGMENAAAITYSERYLREGKKTKRELDSLAGLVLHEVAHMWFGDLVTMKWWNGLWLNETFATYIGTYAMSKSKNYPDAWLYFGINKARAYNEDEAVTTHPIEVPIPDILTTNTVFDGITYNKGAAVMKQLATVGEEKFRDGLRHYFKAHQYGNTDIRDFLNSIAAGSGLKDLDQWGAAWLRESGVDTVRVEATCVRDKYATFDLVITPPPGSTTHRPHLSGIGLYDERNGKITARKIALASFQGPKTSVPELIGQDCAAFVYPNTLDKDYIKIDFDPVSLKTLGDGLDRIDDPLTRAMIWVNLFQMLRDQKLKLTDYSRMALNSLKVETNIEVIEKILDNVIGRQSGYQSVRDYFPRSTAEEKKAHSVWISGLENLIWARFQKAAPGSDAQKIWFDAYVRGVETTAGGEKLASVLLGKIKLKGFTLDQERRWDLVIKISQVGNKDAEALIAAEEIKDPSDKGSKQALSARAAFPKDDQKVKMFNDTISNKDLSLWKVRSVFSNLNPHTEVPFKKYLNSEFYTRLIKLMNERDQEFVGAYLSLVPRGCQPEGTQKLDAFLKEKGAELVPGVSKPLRVTLQEEQRCLKIREFSAAESGITKK